MFGFLSGKQLNKWTGLFLATTVLTSVTGFGFPFDHLLPAHKVGILSLVALAVAIPALYVFKLAGGWRSAYVISSLIALYLNVFVLIVQLFEKVPALRMLAPTQSERPFLVAQVVTLVAFVGLTILSAKRFHVLPAPAV
jgi:hypothetical protein